MKKKVLFIYRHDALKNRLDSTGSVLGPTDFLWGMNYVDRGTCDMHFVNAPRGDKRRGIRRFTWFLEQPFCYFVRIGLPLEIFYLFKKEIEWAEEIVCVNDQISLGVLFWKLFGRLKGKKVHCIVMSIPERIKYFKNNKIIILFLSKLLNKADTIFVLSEFVKEEFIKNFNLQTALKTFYFGVDTEFWKPATRDHTDNFILSIGNDMNRDYQTLIDALPEDCKLKIVTNKKLDPKGKNVEFLSGISDEEVRELYQNCLFTVVPSIKLKNESSGLSCALQSMACHKPVIISDAPPLREMFRDNLDCLFYKPQDVDSLRSAIEKLCNSKELRDSISTSGYGRAINDYTCKNMALVLQSVLYNLRITKE